MSAEDYFQQASFGNCSS